jgi:hypothetical protein
LHRADRRTVRRDLRAKGLERARQFSWERRCDESATSTSRRRVARIALVHDWLTGMRGGEKVLEVLCERFPSASLFTLVHLPGSVSPAIEKLRPRHRSSSGCRWSRASIGSICRSSHRGRAVRPRWLRRHRQRQPLLRQVGRQPGRAKHICYCLTPMRYAWDQFDAYFGPERVGPIASRGDAAGDGATGPMGPRRRRTARPLCRYTSLCCGQDPPIL